MYAQRVKDRQKPQKNESVPDSPKKFEHKRSLGQNFLTSGVVPNWMVEASGIKAEDTVLEIGPGTGMLTKALLTTGATIVAVEADIRAIEQLQITFAEAILARKLKLFHGDAREITPASLGLTDHNFKVVANIPYYLSGFLLRSLLESAIQPSLLTFLIQKELAVRIARDKKKSLLSLSVEAFGLPKYQKTVMKGHFFPKPKVDSAILTISNINRDNFKNITPELFFEILHLGLGKKRKQLLSNLTEKYERAKLEEIFTTLNISHKARGEDILLPTWLKLVEVLSTLA